MKYLSLFTGIGGFELGINQAYEQIQNNLSKFKKRNKILRNSNDTSNELVRQSIPICVGYSEINKYAIQIYQKHFPNHKNYGDITKINERELPDFDLLVGGFPCQSFSIAGKRGGFEDTRGTLFFDIARILKQKQPRLCLLENVKGLLSHDEGRTFRTIISALDELGYDVQWQVLNSKNFGVPQNRERVLIVGHLRGTPRPEVFPISGTNGKDIKQINNPRHSNDRIFESDGLSPTLNTMQGGNRQPFIKIPEATKKGYAEAEIGDSINLSVPNSATRRGRIGHGIAQTLDTGMQQHTLSADMKIRRLTPIECERLQGFPDNWTKFGRNEINVLHLENCDCKWCLISDTQRYKCCGNAVTTNVIQAVMEKLL